MLNSERIAARYGNYGVELLAQSQSERYSCLYSEREGERTCRTLAIVLFTDSADAELPRAMAAIRGGASLGATLQGSGWTPDKLNRYTGSVDFDPESLPAVARLLRLGRPQSLALHVYDLEARRGGRAAAVATLIELHHPDYLDTAALQRIYARLPEATADAMELAGWRARVAAIPDRP